MNSAELTPDQNRNLLELAEKANHELEAAGEAGAGRAFNLGCSLTLLPALAVILIVAVFSRLNWVAIFITTVLALVATLIVANLVAYTARTNTMQRTYQVIVQPEIERRLNGLDLDRSVFDHFASQRLPEAAVLQRYLPPIAEDTFSTDKSE